GLARGGPLDAPAARLANRLVGNEPDAPLLELTLTGPVLRALAPCVVAVTGPALAPVVGGEAAPPYTSLALAAGDELRFAPTGVGARSYLALAGGVASRRFLGSASVDLRGLVGRPLRAGDVLGRAAARRAVAGRGFVPHGGARRGAGPFGSVTTLRLLPGPQHEPEAWAASGWRGRRCPAARSPLRACPWARCRCRPAAARSCSSPTAAPWAATPSPRSCTPRTCPAWRSCARATGSGSWPPPAASRRGRRSRGVAASPARRPG